MTEARCVYVCIYLDLVSVATFVKMRNEVKSWALKCINVNMINGTMINGTYYGTLVRKMHVNRNVFFHVNNNDCMMFEFLSSNF